MLPPATFSGMRHRERIFAISALILCLAPLSAYAQQFTIGIEAALPLPHAEQQGVRDPWPIGIATVSTSPVSGARGAWVVAAQGFLAAIPGGDAICIILPDGTCGPVSYLPRAAALTGGAINMGSFTVRAMAGATVFKEPFGGMRPATSARIDAAWPARERWGFMAAVSKSWLGSFYGDNLSVTNVSGGIQLRR